MRPTTTNATRWRRKQLSQLGFEDKCTERVRVIRPIIINSRKTALLPIYVCVCSALEALGRSAAHAQHLPLDNHLSALIAHCQPFALAQCVAAFSNCSTATHSRHCSRSRHGVALARSNHAAAATVDELPCARAQCSKNRFFRSNLTRTHMGRVRSARLLIFRGPRPARECSSSSSSPRNNSNSNNTN